MGVGSARPGSYVYPWTRISSNCPQSIIRWMVRAFSLGQWMMQRSDFVKQPWELVKAQTGIRLKEKTDPVTLGLRGSEGTNYRGGA